MNLFWSILFTAGVLIAFYFGRQYYAKFKIWLLGYEKKTVEAQQKAKKLKEEIEALKNA